MIRDIHLTSVRRVALLGIGWLGGIFLFHPLQAGMFVIAGIVLLLMPAALWRISVIVSLVAIGSDSAGATQRLLKRMITALLAASAVILAFAIPIGVAVHFGSGASQNRALLTAASLGPGIAAAALLVRWASRRTARVDLGWVLTANADKVREHVERQTDL